MEDGYRNMKWKISIVLLMTLLLASVSCKKAEQPDLANSLVGSWELVDMEYSKSVQIGGYTVSVYLAFSSDGNFSMSQTLGSGSARTYSGTWDIDGNVLSGTYSDGKVWGASYEISFSEDRLTMVPVKEDSPEIYTYRRL